MLPLRYAPYDQCADTPNVVVDGSPNSATVLTLSHWPCSPTPVELRDDLSAQIAFRALMEPRRFEGIEIVTNNHFDQDGLVSIFALAEPEAAAIRRDALVDVARAGDFGTFTHRQSARTAMALAALDDDERSPVSQELLATPYSERCASLYEWALPHMAELVDEPAVWRGLWAEEDAHLQRSIDAIESGLVSIAERPDLDLAIVTIPASFSSEPAYRFTQRRSESIHPMAINNATDRFRVAVVHGDRFQLELRYESWVMLVSRPVLQRVDLRPLADELSSGEAGAAQWTADPPSALTPCLRLTDGSMSSLGATRFVELVEQYLVRAPAAWDPFAS